MSERDDITGEIETLTVGQVARAVRWGRVAVAAAWAAMLACGAALGFWFETRTHARAVHETLANEQEKLAAETRDHDRRIAEQKQQLDRLVIQGAATHAEVWLLNEHFHVRHAPAPMVPGKE